MDLLQEIKALLLGVTPDDFIDINDLTQRTLDDMQIAIWEISALVHSEINKREKEFLMK